MKRFKILCMAFILLLASGLFASEAPIRISAGSPFNEIAQKQVPQVIVTSVSDSVTIKNVIVNKGNCKYDKSGDFPAKLSYGQELKILVWRCNILRVDVDTNQGGWSVEFK